jgi:hypothetical protein
MSIESNEIRNPNKKIKYIDDDDDNDSLASALSDYNGVFYGNKSSNFEITNYCFTLTL